ncbi:TolC family outer membrane protein [Kiloniella laminariae]|uniref:TolC family outer membrane protein n=1 Tax=Kiloniella laminariae TaxID=454162 RepID=A0ABT4LP22_9PROT|nr:TolC family outer membrane protein [Kiloniella laminariae]MCZ4282645.1 TolC family outer membrane protein [Kiloniella laminariae]
MNRSALVGLAAFGGVSVFAFSAHAQSLNDALVKAYETNPTLSSAQTGLKSVNESVPQALSNWRPQVTLSGSAGVRRTDTDAPSGDSTDTTQPLNATLQVTQSLYRGGRTVAATEQAENLVLAQRANVVAVEQDVLLKAVSAYASVWRDQAVLELNVNNEKVLARQLEATKDRFEVGELTRTDVAQSESRLATATAKRIASEGTLNTSKAAYIEIVGAEPIQLERPNPFGTPPASQSELLGVALENNPSVLAAKYNELAAIKQVREVTGELYPEVALVGSVSRSDETSSKDVDSTSGEIIAQVTVPLYQQGLVSSRVRQAKQDANQRRIQIAEQSRSIEQQGVSSWENLVTAQAQIQSFTSAVEAAEIALEGVRQEEEVGERTILDVLDAEQELLDAQVNLVSAERDEVIATYQVLGAMGQLTAQYLGLPVNLFDPAADYNKVRDKWFGLEIEK